MAQVTAPVILDSTGQQIVTALNNLSNNVKPTADQIKRTSSNNQTVEAALVSLNSQKVAYALGNDTIANIQSAIVTLAGTMADGEIKNVRCNITVATGIFRITAYIGELMRISSSRLCINLRESMDANEAVVGNYKDGTWYWAELATKEQVTLKRKVKTYTNLTLPNTDNPYTQIDDYNGLGVNTSYYLVSMIIRGWSNTHVGNMTLLKSSNGSEFYIMGATGGTIGSVTVEYFFVPSVDAL